MRRIGIVLGISLVVAMLGSAAFTLGSHGAWASIQRTASPSAKVVQGITYGALQVDAAPTAPTNVHATVKDTTIDLAWNAVPDAQIYSVYRGTSSHGESKAPYATGIVSLFFFNSKNIDPKVTYYYYVTATNRAGQESEPSAEVSASLTPAAPVTTIAHQPAKANSPGFLPILIFLGLLLLGLGGWLLVRSRAQPRAATTGQLPAHPDADEGVGPGAAYGDAPLETLKRTPTVTPGNLRKDSPYTDAWNATPSVGQAPPPPLPLPSNAAASEGLVARYGGNAEGVLADSEPLRELLPDEGAWFGDTGDVPSLHNTGARFRSIQDSPAWPVQRPRDYTSDDEPDSRRTLLMVGAGASFVLGVMALFLFLFFNFFTAGNATTPQTAVGGQPTQAAATATNQPNPTATTIPAPPTAIVAISSGGPGSGAFSGDTEVNGGQTDTVNDSIDLSAAQNPAPEAVYQSERWGEFTYHLTNFTPNGTYLVRLHFAETYFKQPGKRIFNVFINGQQVLSNFDIVATIGAPDKAVIESFTTTADGNGTITIDFKNGPQNNAKSSGIEVYPAG